MNSSARRIVSFLLVCAVLFMLTACSETGTETGTNIGTRPSKAEKQPFSVQNGDYATAIENAEIGSEFFFGVYEQDGNEYNGKEPIQWRVLDKNEKGILLLSEYILDYVRYEYDEGMSSWDVSYVREDCSLTWIQHIFDEDELKHIRWSNIRNSRNPEYGEEDDPDTIDKMFLLSYDEVIKYLPDDSSRIAEPTPAAKREWNHEVSRECDWWLRTSGETQKEALFVSGSGSIDLKGDYIRSDGIGQRFALWLMKDEQRDIFGAAELAYADIENAGPGSIVLYGNCDIDADSSTKEPIEWIVLSREDDKLLLLSRYVIEKMRFGTNEHWKTSEVREWLNEDFYNSVFDDAEKAKIQRMITSDETDDLVFLLSAEEARFLFASGSMRIAYPTEHLLANGFKDSYGIGEWWTRSVSTALNGKGVVIVESDGNVRSAGSNPLAPEEYTYTDTGVRPVLCINLATCQEEAMNMELFGVDSNTDLDNEKMPVSGGNNSGGGTKCLVCNGTGYVKYYYGSSDLQAILDGYDPYTVGKCTSCKGTGRG